MGLACMTPASLTLKLIADADGIHVSHMGIFTKYPESKFLSEAAAPHVIDVRQRLEGLFEAIDGYEDAQFGVQLDRDPFSRIWEMMVATILRNSGLKFGASKGGGPDFIATHEGKRIAVEATCPGLGQEGLPDSVPPLKPAFEYQLRPDNQMLLRIANAIAEKKRVFEQYLQKEFISSTDCCVIAVSSLKFNQARGRWPCLGISATLGHGLPYAAFDAESGTRLKEGFQFQPMVQKANESAVDMTPFLDNSNSIIAGLLYSDASPYSLDFQLTKETYFIHNPKAKHPIAPGTFKVGQELQAVIEKDEPITAHWNGDNERK